MTREQHEDLLKAINSLGVQAASNQDELRTGHKHVLALLEEHRRNDEREFNSLHKRLDREEKARSDADDTAQRLALATFDAKTTGAQLEQVKAQVTGGRDWAKVAIQSLLALVAIVVSVVGLIVTLSK